MAQSTVRFSPTPNPNAGKFTVNRALVDGSSSKSFYNAEDAAHNALAAALFELEGVASVFMVADFVTVTKDADANWEKLVPEILGIIERALS